tara:strand:+ start:80 stop:298 length:219 start_codon:yes stop_codon:yes gene_type:complete
MLLLYSSIEISDVNFGDNFAFYGENSTFAGEFSKLSTCVISIVFYFFINPTLNPFPCPFVPPVSLFSFLFPK